MGLRQLFEKGLFLYITWKDSLGDLLNEENLYGHQYRRIRLPHIWRGAGRICSRMDLYRERETTAANWQPRKIPMLPCGCRAHQSDRRQTAKPSLGCRKPDSLRSKLLPPTPIEVRSPILHRTKDRPDLFRRKGAKTVGCEEKNIVAYQKWISPSLGRYSGWLEQ